MRFQFQHTNRVISLDAAGAALNQLQLEGVRYSGTRVTFDRRIWNDQLATIAAASITGSSIELPVREVLSERLRSGRPWEPSEKDLALINSKHTPAGVELSMDDVFIFQRYGLNSGRSRNIGLEVDDLALAKYALDASEGRARAMHHDTRIIVGKVFKGEIVEGTINGVKGRHLRTTEYILRRDDRGNQINQELIAAVRGGVLAYDSCTLFPGGAIEFLEVSEGSGKRSVIKLSFDKKLPKNQHTRLDEVSFVYLGEVPGAGFALSGAIENRQSNNANAGVSPLDLDPEDKNANGGVSYFPMPARFNPFSSLSLQNALLEDVEVIDDPGGDEPATDSDTNMKSIFLTLPGRNKISLEVADNVNDDKIMDQIQRSIDHEVDAVTEAKDAEIKALNDNLKLANEERDAFKDQFASQLTLRAKSLAEKRGEKDFDEKGKHAYYMTLSASAMALHAKELEKQLEYSVNVGPGGAPRDKFDFVGAGL